MPRGPDGGGGGVAGVVNEVVPGLLCPAVVLATTWTLYGVPGDSVVYDTLVPLVVLVKPPFSVTVYVTSQLAVEAAQLIEAEVEVTLEVPTLVGAVGTAHGASVVKDVVPGPLDPASLLATTCTLYVVPGFSPVYETLDAVVVLVWPPFSVTVYVTGQPGTGVAAVHETIAAVWATLVAAMPSGIAGNVHARVENDPVPGLLDPASLVATTWML